MHDNLTEELLKEESKSLAPCPFCGGKARFITNKSKQIILEHLPDAGVVCPARYYQYCDTFDQGKLFWNTRY